MSSKRERSDSDSDTGSGSDSTTASCSSSSSSSDSDEVAAKKPKTDKTLVYLFVLATSYDGERASEEIKAFSTLKGAWTALISHMKKNDYKFGTHTGNADWDDPEEEESDYDPWKDESLDVDFDVGYERGYILVVKVD